MIDISVLVVDDQSLIRGAVAELVKNEKGMAVIGEATNGRDAVRLTADLEPDVVLMDIKMPIMDGLEATRLICAQLDRPKPVRVLILTTFEQDDYVAEALRAGASGFIGKATEPHDLTAAIRTVHKGESLLSPLATRALIDRYVASAPSGQRTFATLDALTAREVEVLTLVGRGLSNEEISRTLFISPHTSKTHVSRIMVKLHTHDRAQMVIAAYESGIVSPGRP